MIAFFLNSKCPYVLKSGLNLLKLTIVLLCCLTSIQTSDAQEEFVIQNRRIENGGILQSGTNGSRLFPTFGHLPANQSEALWVLENVPGTNFRRIKNVGRNAYLHMENYYDYMKSQPKVGGIVQLGQINMGWHSAMWILEPTAYNYFRIKNRWTGKYIHIEGGYVRGEDIYQEWWGAMWSFRPKGTPIAKPEPPVVKPDPKPTPDPNVFLNKTRNDFNAVATGRSYTRISNKTIGDHIGLNYVTNDKTFKMTNSVGRWKLQPVSGSYRIYIEVNGKFWSLSANRDAYPKLDNPKGPDMYQLWNITRQSDGYYKISNVKLLNDGSPYPHLFYDAKKSELFLMSWDEAKSLNGRWLFTPTGAISRHNDAFDGRGLRLTSAAINQQICINYMWTSDATGENYLGPCKQGEYSTIHFEKAMNGYYYIRLTYSVRGKTYHIYLNSRMGMDDPDRVNLMEPQNYYSWRILDRGNGYYMIQSVENNKVFQFKKGYYRNTGSAWNNGMPDRVSLENANYTTEQLWRLN